DDAESKEDDALAVNGTGPRPAYSILGHDRWKPAGIEPIRDWRAALAEAFPAVLAAERQTGVTSQ
ncbi:dTDP-4-dehydrorhamnose reductase, partial [Streptomyces sp. NPDC059134]